MGSEAKDPDYAPSGKLTKDDKSEDEEDEENSSNDDEDEEVEDVPKRKPTLEELERKRQAEHKRRHAEAVKIERAAWKKKKAEFKSLAEKEKKSKRLSMEEAVEVAKKRLKMQEDVDEDSEDDEDSDDDTNESRSRHRLDNLDFLKQIGVNEEKQSMKRKSRLKQLEKQVVAPKEIEMTPLRPLSRRTKKTPPKFDNSIRERKIPIPKSEPPPPLWTKAWAITKEFGHRVPCGLYKDSQRLSRLPHYVSNVEHLFRNYAVEKDFVKKAGTFLHLIMFGYDFFEDQTFIVEDDDDDDEESPQASASRACSTKFSSTKASSTRASTSRASTSRASSTRANKAKALQKSICGDLTKSSLRSLFEKIASFRIITRTIGRSKYYRDGVWDALDYLYGRGRERGRLKDDVRFYARCAMLMAAPGDIPWHTHLILCRCVQLDLNALLELITDFFIMGVSERNCSVLMQDLMIGTAFEEVYRVVDPHNDDDDVVNEENQDEDDDHDDDIGDGAADNPHDADFRPIGVGDLAPKEYSTRSLVSSGPNVEEGRDGDGTGVVASMGSVFKEEVIEGAGYVAASATAIVTDAPRSYEGPEGKGGGCIGVESKGEDGIIPQYQVANEKEGQKEGEYKGWNNEEQEVEEDEEAEEEEGEEKEGELYEDDQKGGKIAEDGETEIDCVDNQKEEEEEEDDETDGSDDDLFERRGDVAISNGNEAADEPSVIAPEDNERNE